jgi:hypothetical protein
MKTFGYTGLLPAICKNAPRSRAGAVRQYNAALRAYVRAFDGGGAFGYDWPTMRSNSVETFEFLRALQRAWFEVQS